MFLGLVLHAGVFFAYWPIDPKVPHADASMSIHFLKESIHTFRMELFFLVAGFFSAMLCRSRGLRGFLSNRIQRIVIPFGLCVLLMEPWIAAEYFLQNSFSNETFGFVTSNTLSILPICSNCLSLLEIGSGTFGFYISWHISPLALAFFGG